MHGVHGFLLALTIVLCVAAGTTVLFQRLRQPVVLGYILAGLIVGPHVPVPLVADRETVQTLSQLGVRGKTGASVVAISRADGSAIVPTASERLRGGDLVALAGTHEAIASALELLDADAPDGGAADAAARA